MQGQLDDLIAFSAVVDAGSFTAAARDMGVPTSTVSRKISRLEERLGTQLLRRTTRQLHLTDAGQVLYDRASRLALEVEDAERAVRALSSEPKGKVRITAPYDLAPTLWPLFSGFLGEYPEVEIETFFSERFVDLIGEGFDLAIRGGEPPDSTSLVARPLARAERLLVASPGYLEASGTVESPEALSQHACVLFSPWSHDGHWELHQDGGSLRVPVQGKVRSNDFGTIRRAALDGLGIAQTIRAHVMDDLQHGALIEVLPGVCPGEGSIWAIYPQRRTMLSAAKALVDWMLAHADGCRDIEQWPRS